jgi:hypothetical protein
MLTFKYSGADGSVLWKKRYNGPANGNDGAAGIAVAPDRSIYVTGYSANASGGSDIVTIKYVMPTTIQKKLMAASSFKASAHPALTTHSRPPPIC